jgi:hypothetical protein
MAAEMKDTLLSELKALREVMEQPSPTTPEAWVEATTRASHSTALIPYTQGVAPGAQGSFISQGDLLRMIAQACAEGTTSEDEGEDEVEWTGPQIALATAAVLMGAAAFDRAMVSLYRKLAVYERQLDHEQQGEF